MSCTPSIHYTHMYTHVVSASLLWTMRDLVLDGLVKVLHKLGVHPKQKADQLATLGTRGSALKYSVHLP